LNEAEIEEAQRGDCGHYAFDFLRLLRTRGNGAKQRALYAEYCGDKKLAKATFWTDALARSLNTEGAGRVHAAYALTSVNSSGRRGGATPLDYEDALQAWMEAATSSTSSSSSPQGAAKPQETEEQVGFETAT
jgi:hypothetical protein